MTRATDYNSLIDAIRLRKDELGISNADLEELAGLSPNHVDKVLGPSHSKGLSGMVISVLMDALAFDFIIEPNKKKEERIRKRFKQRAATKVRGQRRLMKDHRLSLAMSEAGKKGGTAYASSRSAPCISKNASKAGRASALASFLRNHCSG